MKINTFGEQKNRMVTCTPSTAFFGQKRSAPEYQFINFDFEQVKRDYEKITSI